MRLKLLGIMFLLKRHGASTIGEIAEAADMHPRTIRRHINTMQECGFVQKDGTTIRLTAKYAPNRVDVYEEFDVEVKVG